MKFKRHIYLLIIFVSTTIAQDYDVSECIKIALDRKGTLVSAGLDVESANQGLLGSYSGLLPSLNVSTASGKTKYPDQEIIIPDLVNLEIDTIKSGKSSYMSAGLSINQTINQASIFLNPFGNVVSCFSFAEVVQCLAITSKLC